MPGTKSTSCTRARTKKWFGTRLLSVAQKKLVRLSQFQAIGWFFKAVDIMAEGSLLDQLNGMFCFDREVDQLGIGADAPIHLLCSASWDERFFVAWCLIGTRERELAKQLIAGGAHNFWPDTRFCETGWEDRVQAWLANLPTGESDHVQFEIVRFVGQPPRNALQFAQ
ncbi:hypothetical protein ACIPZF_15550 [Pseudomonas sp. NPDC089752]|uniref:hypothetical protein n=1 Tax=Pseudomonas sp. NPDC089752 TaxID=3364472 RepID=UPI00380A7826